MAKKTDIDQSIEDFRSKGGGSRHTIKRVLGGKLDKNGAPFHKENMQFEDENEGARIVDVVQTSTCSFGHTIDDKVRVAGICEVGGEVLCSTEGCMLQCVECGAAVGTFGHNGTGKTYLTMHLAQQAIKAGLTIWIFDIEDEYSRLMPLFPNEQLVALEPEQLKFNFFQPPGDWIKPASWMDELDLLLRGATFLRDGSLNLFRTGLTKMFERKGITNGQTDWPSLVEVINYFQGLKFGPKMRSAGMIGREKKPATKPMITMSNLLDLRPVVSRTIIAL